MIFSITFLSKAVKKAHDELEQIFLNSELLIACLKDSTINICHNLMSCHRHGLPDKTRKGFLSHGCCGKRKGGAAWLVFTKQMRVGGSTVKWAKVNQTLDQRGNLAGFFMLRMMDECNRRIERCYNNWHCLVLSVTPCSRLILQHSHASGLVKISTVSAALLMQLDLLHSAFWLCHEMSGKFSFKQWCVFWFMCKRKLHDPGLDFFRVKYFFQMVIIMWQMYKDIAVLPRAFFNKLHYTE